MKSKTGIYHVILRGINRQVIFDDDEDNGRLVETLERYKSICDFKLYAYCLMRNHIHLLLETGKEDLDLVIKRVAGSYVYWYNLKYKRSGHLFQDRFRSEAVENDRYFLTVLRYIHQNPVAAGLCKEPAAFKYSSYKDYLNDMPGLLDTDVVFSIIDKEQFFKLVNEKKGDLCLDIEDEDTRLNDPTAMVMIQSLSGCRNAAEFQLLEAGLRDCLIFKLRSNGLSIRQICRLTGISFGTVRRMRENTAEPSLCVEEAIAVEV